MTSWMKARMFDLVSRMGYTVIPTWRIHRFSQVNYMKNLINFLSIDCIVDVGANTGQYARYLRDEVGYGGLICSFEPIPAHTAALRRDAARDPKWQVEECALGRSAERKIFHVTSNTEFSSFLAPDMEFGDFNALAAVAEEIPVTVRTLDDVVPRIRERHGVKNIHLKLDTQGYDLEVLAGGKNTIGDVASLQSEMAVQRIYEGMPDFREATRFIEDQGFVISQFFPNNEGHFPKLIEFDCYAINRARIGGSVVPAATSGAAPIAPA